MENQGLHLADPREDFRLYADLISVGDLTISRLYHNARNIIRERTTGGVRVSIIADGEAAIADRSQSFSLVKGAAFVHASNDAVSTQMDSPCGTVELDLSPQFSTRMRTVAPLRLQVAPPELGTTRLLLAAVLTTLNSGPTETEESWRRVHDVIENAAAAFLSETAPRHVVDRFGTFERLLMRAQDVIDYCASDKDFGVTELCEQLSTSSTQLYRAFATTGTRPLIEIHRARLATARTIQQRRAPLGKEDRESIAHLAGFRSWRALKAAERLVENHDAATR